ncbi:uncharacterized protein (DUF1499 family) [Hypnocyclicus thermotrophus]|uniref:Uncharacterized protein (DUF1499 family) n=1 Tax=Hypnocyclicus thermotrophus TaxID=1627895 RepID=A0AA46E0Q6_9FUSO|nr:DUF1499 domain-containing protein [Hypnocyclicus thermotrophus]TDT72601.1 uncharacterized protein (DUF1499 family) [Hypnocyclicus thermotrophus]
MNAVVAVFIILVGGMTIKNNVEPKNIGVINGKFYELKKSPNNISSQTDIKEKYVEPLKFIENKEKSYVKILEVLNSYENAKIERKDKNYIHVVFKTSGLKFKDDVEFYFDENEKVIHFKSASRVGYSDMGKNRERYEEIKKRYYR